MKFETQLIHAATRSSDGGVLPAIQLSTTFAQPTDGSFGEFVYQRGHNPTRAAAEQALRTIEDAGHAIAFSTGMAAIAAVTSLLGSGERLVTNNAVYGGTYRLVTIELPRQGIAHSFIDDLNALVSDGLPADTRGILIETPSNPTLEVIGIARLAELAHARGAWLAVDNTFATPYLQRPLELGADLVIHSATKYLGGHADVIAGVVLTNDDALADRLRFHRRTAGAGLAPFDSYSLIRGLKTLAIRLDRQQQNTARVLDFLKTRPEISKVYWPGSASDEQAAIQASQSSGNGAVLAFELVADANIRAFLDHLGFIDYAVSLGGVETLVSIPIATTHEDYSPAHLAAAGITDRLIRIAIGIEDADDIIEALGNALSASTQN